MAKLVMLMLFAVGILFQFASSSASTDSANELDKLREYLSELKKNLNTKVDPCVDFWEYSTHNSVNEITYKDSRNDIFDLFMKTEPRDNTETQVMNFVTSWKGTERNNTELIYEQIGFLGQFYDWTDTTSENYTVKDVAKLLGELCAVNNGFLIKFSSNFREFTLPRDFKSEIYRDDLPNPGMKLSSDNLTGADISEIINNMRETLEEFTNYRVTRPKVYTIKEIKEKIPDFEWDEFLQPIYEAYNITKNEAFSLIKFDVSMEMLEGVINFVKTTDRKKLVQYMVIRFSEFLKRFPWEIDHVLVFRKYLNEYLTQDDISQFDYILNHHTKTKDLYRDSMRISDAYVNHDLKLAIDILSNPEKFLPQEYMENLLGETEMDPDQYYQNLYNFVRNLHKNRFTQRLNKLPSETIKFMAFVESYNDYNFDIFSPVHNKPKIQYFISFLTRIWYKWFDTNQQFKEYSSAEFCWPEYTKLSVRKINKFSATKMAYLDFVRFLNSELGEREVETEILKEFGFVNYNQLFFIALAQNSNRVFYPYGEDAQFFLERFDGISKAFNCPIDSPVNFKSTFTTCQNAPECIPAHENLELLPYKLPYCVKR